MRNYLVLKHVKSKTFVCLDSEASYLMLHPEGSAPRQEFPRTPLQRPARFAAMTGYVPRFPMLHRLYNLCIGVVLFAVFLPLLVCVAAVLRYSQGPQVLARSRRLGKDRKPFELLSFTTTPTALLARVDAPHRPASPFALYLRQTGLDALPQLINVIRGDLNILGPRPVRAAIAGIEEARDPLYAIRFTVRPGLWGHTQAFMGPGASQRLRGKLTYRLCRTSVNLRVEMLLTARIAVAILSKAVRQALLWGRRRPGDLARARRKAQDWQITLETAHGAFPVYALSQGLLTTPHVMTDGTARLVFGTHNGVRKAQVELGRLSHLQGETVFHYFPAHENAGHLISRYLKQDTVVTPRRPKWQPPRLSDLRYELALHLPRETVPAAMPRRH